MGGLPHRHQAPGTEQPGRAAPPSALLAEQAADNGAFYVLVAEDGSVWADSTSAMMEGMTAVPADDHDPDDPDEILAVLPARYHQKFLADYEAALTSARRPQEYRQLRHVLRLWRLRAVACSDPSFEDRLQAARSGTSPRIPAGQIPGWNARMAAERRRRGQA
jgi:hypothetical protein